MKKLINKITIHIDKEKVKNWVKSKKFRKIKDKNKSDYYICRVCRRVISEDYMSPNDNSICNSCSKH